MFIHVYMRHMEVAYFKYLINKTKLESVKHHLEKIRID